MTTPESRCISMHALIVLIELWFYVPLNTKQVISFPIFWLGMKKTKPKTTKARIHQSTQMYYNTK